MQLLGLWAYLGRHLRDGGELLGKLLTDDGADPVRFPFLDLYSAVMDIPAEVFLDIMRHVYQERTLVRGKFRVRNHTVALRSIRATALMTVEGEDDDIAAPGQTQRAHDLCPYVPADARQRLVVPDAVEKWVGFLVCSSVELALDDLAVLPQGLDDVTSTNSHATQALMLSGGGPRSRSAIRLRFCTIAAR